MPNNALESKPLRVAVIGARGQLGSALCLEAGDRGLEVLALNRPDFEITDEDLVFRALDRLRPGLVVNTAAYHRVDDCQRNPELAFKVNCAGALNVARACHAVGAVLVQLSTDQVFRGDTKGLLRESSPRAPVNVYGESRARAEDLVAQACPRHYTVRIAGLFGVGALGRGGNFPEKVLEALASGGDLAYVSDRLASVVYAVDAARALLELATRGLPFGTWHVVNTGACSWFQQADFVARALRSSAVLRPLDFDSYPFFAPRPRHCALSVEKLALNGIEMPPWQDGLRRYLQQRGLLPAT